MTTSISAKSADSVQAIMQLRCRQEVLERWLASQVLPAGLHQSLYAMLVEVTEQLNALMDIGGDSGRHSGEGRDGPDPRQHKVLHRKESPSGGGPT